MAIKIGTSTVKGVYVGTSRAKLIYIDKTLVFADPQSLTLTLGTGVASVSYVAKTVDSKVQSGVIYSSTTLSFGYGTFVSFTCSSATGYTMNSYTASVTLTEAKSVSFTAKANTYTTYLNLRYNSTEYGNSIGDKIGTVQYSINNSTWVTASDANISQIYGGKIYLRSVSAAPGFVLSSVQYNGSTISASGGVYTITVGAGNYSLNVNYTASQSGTNATYSQAESVSTNRLYRTGFNVQCYVDIRVKECDAGTVIGTIPYQYRPATNQTFTTDWKVTTGTTNSTTQAKITFHTNGNITSDTVSNGSGSSGGGGKWGSYSVEWYTKISFTVSWSIR